MEPNGTGKASRRAAALAVLLAVPLAAAARGDAVEPATPATGTCTDTTAALYSACNNSVRDDYWVAYAKCLNVTDAVDRNRCFRDASRGRDEGYGECVDRRGWRLQSCTVVGEAPYDPPFDPADFDTDFWHLTHPNPYFPLTIGNVWQYSSPGERDVVRVLNRTKLVDGVTCIVVRDQVSRGGFVAEDTDDWYAQAIAGDSWYCGEETKDYETFAGDRPRAPELVSIDGSFKAGREREKAGIIFLDSPQVGDAYYEEFALDEAEDVTEVLSVTYSYGHDPVLDQLVPPALASTFCAGGDCVVTKNWSLLEPGIFSRKYYARGIGVFLEVELDTGTVVRLTGCNFDPRCGALAPQ